MTNFKIKLATSIATATLLAATLAPATFAKTSVKVHNNGKNTTNVAGVINVNATMATQTNNTTVRNLTGVFQNTGGNAAHDTGKGDTTVKSGAANSTVTNNTTTGDNTVTLSNCNLCSNGNTDVTISGNHKNSLNVAVAGSINYTSVTQTNNTTVVNGTVVAQNTGFNKASDTGKGDVSVTSGEANSKVSNTVTTGSNDLTL